MTEARQISVKSVFSTTLITLFAVYCVVKVFPWVRGYVYLAFPSLSPGYERTFELKPGRVELDMRINTSCFYRVWLVFTRKKEHPLRSARSYFMTYTPLTGKMMYDLVLPASMDVSISNQKGDILFPKKNHPEVMGRPWGKNKVRFKLGGVSLKPGSYKVNIDVKHIAENFDASLFDTDFLMDIDIKVLSCDRRL